MWLQYFFLSRDSLLGSDELPSLDSSFNVYVPCLAFWCLCINVKFHTVMFVLFGFYILFLAKVMFCFPLYCVFSSADCDDM